MPTATSQRCSSAWAPSQTVAAAQSRKRPAAWASPSPSITPRNIWMSPISMTKCGLKGPVWETPGTTLYHMKGVRSIASPFPKRNMAVTEARIQSSTGTGSLLSIVFMTGGV